MGSAERLHCSTELNSSIQSLHLKDGKKLPNAQVNRGINTS